MLREWSHIKYTSHSSRGFSPVEIVLAVTVFGFLVVALAGALIYGMTSTAQAGDRARAVMLAEEGTEAVRNIRDASYANLISGTYGLAQSGNIWTLSGTSDTSGIYTRQIIVADNGTDRKTVTTRITWTQGSVTRQFDAVTQLTNWAAIIKTWANAAMVKTLDLTGTLDGLKIATQGNYAYVVRADGTPDFMIINMT
ncbi:MAG: hypothetical protein JWP13_654, partial [Candidatus Saccharibacteria bacterium]|nr:hypothetical protein [Candidatus Saccharibacteria bacterium]